MNDTDQEPDEEIALESDAADLARQYIESCAAVAEWETIRKDLREKLIKIIGPAHFATVNGERALRVTHAWPKRFDADSFKTDHPGLYHEYVRPARKEQVSVHPVPGYGRSPL